MEKYFAADEPHKLVGYLEKEMGLSFTQKNGSGKNSGVSGLTNMWDKNYRAYYSNNLDDLWNAGGVKFTGREGELVMASVNQARALLGEYNTLISKQRLSFEAIASRDDAESYQSARLGNAIANQLVTDENLDLKADLLIEHAGVLGAGFIYPNWNPLGGKLLTRNAQGMKFTGKIDYKVLSVYDVFYDYMNPDFYNLDWVVICWEENRWDLIAQYPHLEKEIRALPAVEPRFIFNTERRQEKIKVMGFIHKKSSALPDGRMVVFSSADVVFFDDINPYGFIPLVECAPSKILGTGVGYPLFSELLPAQELFDSCISTTASNQAAFGLQNILVPNQADMNMDHIGGLNFIKYNLQSNGGGEPKALQLCNTPPEIFKFAEMLLQYEMHISKVNSAIRGSPPPGVTSGTAIATLTANAIELVQSGSKAYILAMEKLMGYSFQILQKFATEEQTVNMVGRNKKTIVAKWKNTDIAAVQGVKMKTSNPLSQTVAGRIMMTEHQMQLGLIKNPTDYQTVMETGTTAQNNDDALDETIWIMQENDMIREGQPVMAAKCEKHALHYNDHRKLLFDPIVRNDPNKLQALLAHLEEHEMLGQTTDPWILGVVETGQLPPPQPMMPGMPPQGAPQPEGGANPQDMQQLLETDIPQRARPASPAEPVQAEQGGQP